MRKRQNGLISLGVALLLALAVVAAASAAAELTRPEYVAQLEKICKPGSEATQRAVTGMRSDIRAERLRLAASKFAKAETDLLRHGQLDLRGSAAGGGSSHALPLVRRPRTRDGLSRAHRRGPSRRRPAALPACLGTLLPGRKQSQQRRRLLRLQLLQLQVVEVRMKPPVHPQTSLPRSRAARSPLAVVPAGAEQTGTPDVRVSFDGKISPRNLPRHRPAPVSLELSGTVRGTDGAAASAAAADRAGVRRPRRPRHRRPGRLPPRPPSQRRPRSQALARCRAALVGRR